MDSLTLTTGNGCTPGAIPTATYSNNRPNMKIVAEAQACSNLRTAVTLDIDSTSADAVASFLEVNPATGTFEFYAGGSTGQAFTWTFGDGGTATGDTVSHTYGISWCLHRYPDGYRFYLQHVRRGIVCSDFTHRHGRERTQPADDGLPEPEQRRLPSAHQRSGAVRRSA